MNPQLSELLGALLHSSILGVEEERHFFAHASSLGVDMWQAEQMLEEALRPRGIIREKDLLEEAERLVAPRVRDKFLDIEEEKYTLRALCDKWKLDPNKALSIVRQIVARHGAIRAEDLREEFEGYLFSRLEQGSRVPRSVVEYLLQLAHHRNIQDEAGVEALIDDICLKHGWLREDATGSLPGANASGAFYGAPGAGQGFSTGSFGAEFSTGSFAGTHAISVEQAQQARRLIMARIGNDRYLDQAEENEYFAKAGDELGLNYEVALQLLEQTLQQYNAVRERTAVEELCHQLAPMLDDQYLDSAELQRAYLIGQELGLDRAEDVDLIDKIIQKELAKRGALTEPKARDWLRDYVAHQVKKKRISPDILAQGVESLLKEYRLAHKEETREQVELLAREIVQASGYTVKAPSSAGLLAAIVLFCALLGGGSFFAWKTLYASKKPGQPALLKATLPVGIGQPAVPRRVVPGCNLSAAVQARMENWLARAKSAYRSKRFTTPVEDCVNLWTQNIINKVRTLCPGVILESQPVANKAQALRTQTRDFYISMGRRAITRGKSRKACQTWFARARIFGQGEILEELVKQHCSRR